MHRSVLEVGEIPKRLERNIRAVARDAIVRNGNEPHVIKVENIKQLFLGEEALIETYDDISNVPEDADELNELVRELMTTHLQQFGCIGVIVMDESTWNALNSVNVWGGFPQLFKECKAGNYPFETYVVRGDALCKVDW